MHKTIAHFIMKRPYLIEKDQFNDITEGLQNLIDHSKEFGIKTAGFNTSGAPLIDDSKIEFNGDEDQGFMGLHFKKFINSNDEVQMIETAGGEYDVFVIAFLELVKEVLGDEFHYISSEGEESRSKGKALLSYSRD